MNSGSAGTGKMFSPQSIAIAIGAVAPALEAYIEANKSKIDDSKAKELRDSIAANVIMTTVLKYFIIFIVANGIISYFGHNFISAIEQILLK